jgi:uncharacterized Tic20 family protein
MPRNLEDRANVDDALRTRAALCHLSAVVGFVLPFGAFLAPYLVWRVYRTSGELVDRHGRAAVDVNVAFVSLEALVFLMAGSAYLLGGPPWLVVGFTFAALAVGLAHVGAILYGAARAATGEEMDLGFRVRVLGD